MPTAVRTGVFGTRRAEGGPAAGKGVPETRLLAVSTVIGESTFSFSCTTVQLPAAAVTRPVVTRLAQSISRRSKSL
eukprot:COSAG05_NODE_16161_length_352_cov_0.822134_2_plen_75_part_01